MGVLKNYHRIKYDEAFVVIIASCVCSLLQLFFMPRGNNAVVSISVRALQLVWLLAAGRLLLARVKEPFSVKMVGLLLLMLCSALSYLFASISDQKNMWTNLVGTLGFWSLPLMLYYGTFANTANMKKAVLFFHILTSLVYIGLYYSDYRHIFHTQYGTTYVYEVTLGYPNANQAAMYLLVCAIGLSAGIFFFKSGIAKLLLILDTGHIMWIIIQTGSRAAILVLLMYALFLLTLKYPVTKLWVQIVFWIPLIYLLLPFLGAPTTKMRFMNDLLFNGREIIFQRYFDNLSIKTFLFGDMNLFGYQNLHNGYIAIAASAGVITCVCFVHFLRNCVYWHLPARHAPMYERIAFLGFLCIILQTSAEAAYFTGGVNYAFLVFSIFTLFANNIGEKKKSHEQGAEIKFA